jgi:hypothetical protein
MPETVALAKALRAEGLPLRKIGAALAQEGYVTSGGKEYDAVAVLKMVMSAA